jgi:Cytochrome c554 and c-prime
MNDRLLALCIVAAVGVAVAVVLFPRQGPWLPQRAEPSEPAVAKRHTAFPLVGTPSCSAHACHGGTEPALNDSINRDEYTTWLPHDRHANAFRVLFEDRSKNIAKNLGLAKPAFEDVRCLACHTNPLVVGSKAEDVLRQTPDSPQAFAIRAERYFGVGCESCHGPAGQWLQGHTEHGWARKIETNSKAEELGFQPMRNLDSRAQVCVGCHVGARADAARGLPARDMNHDLIAAGHPRMDFELGAFLANLPPHWNEKAWKIRRAATADLDDWLIGQLASAQAGLELLAERADPDQNRPWPELAEYDCFACHHGLQTESWRQKRGYGTRKPGSLPWGQWYYSLPWVLAATPPTANKDVDALFVKLTKAMGNPYPDRDQVRTDAVAAHKLLKEWRTTQDGRQYDSKALYSMLVALVAQTSARDFELSPQSAEQLYQAAIALSLARRDQDFIRRNAALSKALRNADGFDSPKDFRPMEFRDALLECLKAIKP